MAADGPTTTVATLGHGTLEEGRFAELLRQDRVDELWDVRSFPGSRHHPQFGREAMEGWVPGHGVAYRWVAELGGRRKPVAGSRHVALRNRAFQAYADHMEGRAFHEGVAALLAAAAERRIAVMCSEAVWWRCHRRLLADHLALVHGVEVVHLMHDGRRTPHPPTEGVRRDGGDVVYDVGVDRPLLD